MVWIETELVAALAAVFASTFYSLGAGWIPAYLLLLSRSLLQGVLGRPAGLHRGRTAKKLLGRTVVPAHHAECPPLFSVSGDCFHWHSGLRRLEGLLVRPPFWHWPGHDRPRD